jgi:hypothetical protein
MIDFCLQTCSSVKKTLFAFFILFASFAKAQKIEAIYFNLYTDSLKKGFYNYISVDGKFTDGKWMPLDSSDIVFSANTGYFHGNDIFIDSSYKGETVKVKAALRKDPSVWKEIVIYIRKRPFDEPLKTNEEVLDDIRNKRKKKGS